MKWLSLRALSGSPPMGIHNLSLLRYGFLMSGGQAIIRYDGPILADHKMDVEDIAPAMLALAELCKRANAIANGDRASVKLLIDLDTEQHCAQFGVQIIQTFLDQAKSFFDDQHVKTASDIMAFIGLTGTTGGIVIGGPVIGLFKLLKWLKGRQPDSATMTVKDGRNVMQISVGGDMVLVHPVAAQMLYDPIAMKSAKDVLRPTRKEGYEKVEFEHQNEVSETLTKQDAILIDAIQVIEKKAEKETVIPASSIRATVKIRKAIYEGNGKWTIQYDKSREVTMGDETWLADFQANKVDAPPGSYLDVDISVAAIHLDKDDKPIEEPHYTITKVNGVVPAPEQIELPNHQS